MVDQVLLSANDHNIEACVQLAREYGLGIEVMTFAFPNVLDSDYHPKITHYQKLLADVPGKRTLHGAFMDMAPGSPDRRINQVCYERYQEAIQIAAELNMHLVVFHANFIGAIRTMEYRVGWHQRNLAFWTPLADYARQHDVTIAIENMWEFDPAIIGDLLKEINHPNLRACLDIGHAHLFSEVPFDDWLTVLGSYIVHTHMNNNDGKVDIHMGFDHGMLNYHVLLDKIRALPTPPGMVLEMDEVDFMRASLPFLKLK
jgi:sugar phosphate isomerase/epimerase